MLLRILILICKRDSVHGDVAVGSRNIGEVVLSARGIGLRRHIVDSVKITAVVRLRVHRVRRSPHGNATRAGPPHNLLLAVQLILHRVRIRCLLLLLLQLARCCCCHQEDLNVKVFEITEIYYSKCCLSFLMEKYLLICKLFEL